MDAASLAAVEEAASGDAATSGVPSPRKSHPPLTRGMSGDIEASSASASPALTGKKRSGVDMGDVALEVIDRKHADDDTASLASSETAASDDSRSSSPGRSRPPLRKTTSASSGLDGRPGWDSSTRIAAAR